MAIKVFCSICDKFISDISQVEVSKITGKEMCPGCQKKISTIFAELDGTEKKFQEMINKVYTDVKKEYVHFQGMQSQKLQEVKTIINNTRPEISRIVRDIIKDNKTQKKKIVVKEEEEEK